MDLLVPFYDYQDTIFNREYYCPMGIPIFPIHYKFPVLTKSQLVELIYKPLEIGSQNNGKYWKEVSISELIYKVDPVGKSSGGIKLILYAILWLAIGVLKISAGREYRIKEKIFRVSK